MPFVTCTTNATAFSILHLDWDFGFLLERVSIGLGIFERNLNKTPE
jgi:hypothetical protein